MNQYTLSRKAEEDISGIYEYSVKTQGTIKAKAYLVAIHEALTMLAKSPKTGSSAEEIRIGYRQFPVHKHMVFYKNDVNGIFVVRVLHQQMKYVMHFSD